MEEKNKVQNVGKKRDANIMHPSETREKWIYYPWIKTATGKTELDWIIKKIDANMKKSRKVTFILYLSPPGMGKTVLAYYLASKYGDKPVVAVSCSPSMDLSDLLGSNTTDGREEGIIWEDGPVPAIIRATNEEGMGFLVLNEFNSLSPSIQIAFNSLFDRQAFVTLTQRNNEVVAVEEGRHLVVIASGNPGLIGTFDIQPALKSRANPIIMIRQPDKTREADLYQKLLGIPLTLANNVAKLAERLRLAYYEDNQIAEPPNPRIMIDFIESAEDYNSFVEALHATLIPQIIEPYNEEQKKFVESIANSMDIERWVLPKKEKSNKKEEVKNKKIKSTTDIERIRHEVNTILGVKKK